MERGMESLEKAYSMFFTAALVILAILMVLCLARAIIGPRIADRIVAANMMGTMVIVIIAVLALMLGEGYLVDICIIYAMISFLAVIVLTRVYTGVYLKGKQADFREASDPEGEKEKSGNGDKERNIEENSAEDRGGVTKGGIQ